jgi:ketosteroid isomerase-like protein
VREAFTDPPFPRDTAWAMSRGNVESFKRALQASNRRDFDAVLEELHPEVEWHPAVAEVLEGRATVYRGREGALAVIRDFLSSFPELQFEFSEIRDLDDRILATGWIRARGAESGIEINAPLAYLARFKEGKAIWVRSYLDPNEALEAAGLSE